MIVFSMEMNGEIAYSPVEGWVRLVRGMKAGRRGVAPLECVMVLPILLVLFLALLQLGVSSSMQARVVVEARYTAWAQRDPQNKGAPFELGDLGKVSARAENRMVVSPLTRAFSEARSQHFVLSGTWDYRKVKLNDGQPNFDEAIRLARKGPVQEIAGRAQDFEKLLGSVSSVGTGLSMFPGGLTSPSQFQGFLDSGALQQRLAGASSVAMNDEVRNAIPQSTRSLDSLGGDLLSKAFPDFALLLAALDGQEGVRRTSDPAVVRTEAREAGKTRARTLQKYIDTLSKYENEFGVNVLSDLARHGSTLSQRLADMEGNRFDPVSEEGKMEIEELLKDVGTESGQLTVKLKRLQGTVNDTIPNAEFATLTKAKADLLAEIGDPEKVQQDLDAQMERVRAALNEDNREAAGEELKKLDTQVMDLNGRLNQLHREVFPGFMKVLREGREKADEPPNVPERPKMPPD
jgi:hypothetical protein